MRLLRKKLPIVFLRFSIALVILSLISLPFAVPVKKVSAAPNPPTDFKIVSGHYTGNGTAQPITGLGFQPKVVIVKGDTVGINAVWRSDAMLGDTTATMALAANISGGVTSLDSDGFTVGSHATVNTSLIEYYYIAFGGSGGDLVTGSYPGNGSDDYSISGIGFQPAFVWIKGDLASQSGHWRSLEHVGDSSSYLVDEADGPNFIQAFEADGFQVGDDNSVNQNGTTYYYVAFKDVPSQMQTGHYTGNGLDNQSIVVQSGFKPDYIWLKAATLGIASPTTRNLKHRPYSVTGDSTLTIFSNANETDHIQDFNANGFQIGTHVTVNENTILYHWVAWRHLPDVPSSLGPTSFTNGSTGTDNTPTLQFSLSDPMSGETVKYRLQIDDSSDFSSPVVDFTSALASQGAASFTVGQDPGSGSYAVGSSGQTLAAGSYYWRVLTTDQNTAPSSYTTANSGGVGFVLAAVASPVSSGSLPDSGSPFALYSFYLSIFCLGVGLFLNKYYWYLKASLVRQLRGYLDEKRKSSKRDF